MKSLRYFIATLTGILGLYHLFGLMAASIALGADRKLGISDGGSLAEQLFSIELGLLLLFFILLVSSVGKWRFRMATALVASICVLAIYVWWFFEKYTFLKIVYGLKEDSSEYKSWLAEIGFFRGMEPIHYWILIPTFLVVISVFIWAGSSWYEKHIKTNQLSI